MVVLSTSFGNWIFALAEIGAVAVLFWAKQGKTINMLIKYLYENYCLTGF